MSGETSSPRRSGRRRRRRPDRPQKNKQQAQIPTEAGSALENRQSTTHQDDLPEVFIYTYTVYKSGD